MIIMHIRDGIGPLQPQLGEYNYAACITDHLNVHQPVSASRPSAYGSSVYQAVWLDTPASSLHAAAKAACEGSCEGVGKSIAAS
jgi:hypothetical protein